MDSANVWCDRHWEAVKDDAASATILLASLVGEHPRFVAACGGVDFASCSEVVIAEAMRTLMPLCCLFDDTLVQGLAGANDVLARLARAAAKGAVP